jgi:hypothetical protein
MATRGTRCIDGRYFLLAGRGTREHCEREAFALRRSWRYVRIVSATPYLQAHLRALLDDWMVYVFEARSDAR